MTELLLVTLAASLVTDFALAHGSGLVPPIDASRRFATATGIALAALLVTTLMSMLGYALWHWLLHPLGLEYLRALCLVLLLAGGALFTALKVRATNPVLHQRLVGFLPLVTANCTVLGVALLDSDHQQDLFGSLLAAIGVGAGFGLALLLFTTLRERLASADVPVAFRGTPVTLVTAGLMALAFMGFTGFGTR